MKTFSCLYQVIERMNMCWCVMPWPCKGWPPGWCACCQCCRSQPTCPSRGPCPQCSIWEIWKWRFFLIRFPNDQMIFRFLCWKNSPKLFSWKISWGQPGWWVTCDDDPWSNKSNKWWRGQTRRWSDSLDSAAFVTRLWPCIRYHTHSQVHTTERESVAMDNHVFRKQDEACSRVFPSLKTCMIWTS